MYYELPVIFSPERAAEQGALDRANVYYEADCEGFLSDVNAKRYFETMAENLRFTWNNASVYGLSNRIATQITHNGDGIAATREKIKERFVRASFVEYPFYYKEGATSL